MANKKTQIVFLATPEFALPALEALSEEPTFEISAVITQPDKPAGRGLKLTPPPVKVAAEAKGITVFQPTSLKGLTCNHASDKKQLVSDNTELKSLCELLNTKADIFVVVAYGKIIPQSLLDFAALPVINIHPSLLPRWRGAAPLQHALFAGDAETGVCIMAIDSGLDTGPVFSCQKLTINETDDLETLHDKLAILGANLLVPVVKQVVTNSIQAQPQSADGATYAEKWDKEDCAINWEEPADITLRRIRTCCPYPGSRTLFEGKEAKIYQAHKVKNQNFPQGLPGEIVEVNKAEVIVAMANSEYISIDSIQFAGRSRLSIRDALKGQKFQSGQKFS